MIAEGLAREIVNRIQKSRKQLNLNVADRINIDYTATGALVDVIKNHHDYICGETLALSLKSSQADATLPLCFTIDDDELKLNIRVASQ